MHAVDGHNHIRRKRQAKCAEGICRGDTSRFDCRPRLYAMYLQLALEPETYDDVLVIDKCMIYSVSVIGPVLGRYRMNSDILCNQSMLYSPRPSCLMSNPKLQRRRNSQ